MPPPPDYYLSYFHELIDSVVARYGDILQSEDLTFVKNFRSVNTPAQRLLVRLLLRKGPLFLFDTLRYPEVPNTMDAVTALTGSELVLQNPCVRAWDLVRLLPISDARVLFANGDRRCKKADLLSRFENDDTRKTPAAWGCQRTIISPAFDSAVRRLNLLYFGNEHQSLTEFVLEDIGMMRFETVPLSPESRFFSCTEEVTFYLRLNDLGDAYEEMNAARNFESLTSLGQQLLMLEPPDMLMTRWAKVANKVAYRLEQLGDLETAAQLFDTNDLPPSRERRCRIAYKKGQWEIALHLLEAIDANPMSGQESAFYRRFVSRVTQKLNLPNPVTPSPAITERSETWPKEDGRVEALACKHIEGAIWRENHLPLGVFGLIFWPVVFADIKGVWHHRFQSAPADLKEPNFRTRRKALVDETLNESKDMWRHRITRNWKDKHGIKNPFVHWTALTLDEVLICFDAFTHTQWCGIFDHLLADIPRHRSGFPDLFVSNEIGGQFIEIKGPGDRLRDNQRLWLNVFSKLKIPAEVVLVTFEDN